METAALSDCSGVTTTYSTLTWRGVHSDRLVARELPICRGLVFPSSTTASSTREGSCRDGQMAAFPHRRKARPRRLPSD
jgi:hypothetical protein